MPRPQRSYKSQRKAYSKALGRRFGWKSCPLGTLDFFYDEETACCDDPFHCCHEEVMDDICYELFYLDTDPDEACFLHSVSNFIPWESGWTFPAAPPFNLMGGFFLATKPGVVIQRCLEKVALPGVLHFSTRFTPFYTHEDVVFRAESAAAGNPEITTEEQGSVVATGPQPSASGMTTLASAATGTQEAEWKLFFAYHTSMNWSTRDGSGKVLFSQALSPKLNPYLKFLSQIYSAWAGSIDVRFTVSGSGVFGGKLAAVVVPPGVDASGGTSLLQFPHVLFDARQTEPVIFNIPDIRKILWHGMEDQDTSTLVIIVYNELINPYHSGADATDCTITVETRPGADFSFNLMKPPTRILKTGKEPSDLIPKSSLLWEGNRLAGTIVTFAINPTIGQANRHFDSNKSTYGWSSPKHGDIICQVTGQNNKRVFAVTTGDSAMLVPGVPDGWPDYTAQAEWSVPTTDLASYDNFAYGQVSACMQYTHQNQGSGRIADHSVIGVGTLDNERTRVTPSNKIWANTLVLVYPKGITQNTKFKLRPMMTIRADANGRPIGDSLNRVCYYDKLPTATTLNGNYPLYYVSYFMSNYGNNGIQVYNSQILTTSANFAQSNYNIGPDSFAVYRIKDSTGRWFDVGISADGFSYVGSFVLNFSALSAPYTASYMGIQSNSNPLAHNVDAGQSRTI
ncbi:ORF2 protein [Mink calicivirus]|uniref:ORF2 protein n=1 Tax=Mink calicivirus TaxID=154122 RepID=UPI00029D16C7|nr:ORF2 protein [Mink calicivirus]AFY07855.1 ORF2 protein [Mink calicivirus]